MSKITVLVHPTGKVWATYEVNGNTELVFGKTSFVEQYHPAGYTESKLGEKLKKGYVALLDQVNISKQSLFSLNTIAQTCQRIAIHRQEDLGPNKDVFANLTPQDRWQFLQALQTQFSTLPGQIERLKMKMNAAQPDGMTPSPTAVPKPITAPKPTASTAPAALTAPAGPWSW